MSVADTPDFDCLRRVRTAGYLIRWDRESGKLDDYFYDTCNFYDGLARIEPNDSNYPAAKKEIFPPDYAARCGGKSMHVGGRPPCMRVNVKSRECLGGSILRQFVYVMDLYDPDLPPTRFCYIQATWLRNARSGELLQPWPFPLSRMVRPSLARQVLDKFKTNTDSEAGEAGGETASGVLRKMEATEPASLLSLNRNIIARRHRIRQKQRADPSNLDKVAMEGVGGRQPADRPSDLLLLAEHFKEDGCRLEVGATSVQASADRHRERWLELAEGHAPTTSGNSGKTPLEDAVAADWAARGDADQPGAERNSFSARFLALSSTSVDDLRKLWLPDPASPASSPSLQGPAFLDLSRVASFNVMTLSLVDGRFEDVESGRPALVTVAGLVSTRPAWDDAKYLFDRLGELLGLDAVDESTLPRISVEASAAFASSILASPAFASADVWLSDEHLRKLLARRVSELGLDTDAAFLTTVQTWLLGRTAIGGVLGRREEELRPEGWAREVAELRRLLQPLVGAHPSRLKTFLRWLAGLRETCLGALRERRDRIFADVGLMEEERLALRLSVGTSDRCNLTDVAKVLLRTLRDHTDHRLTAIQGSAGPWRVRPGHGALVNLCRLEELPVKQLRGTLGPLWPSRPPRALAAAVQRRLVADVPPALLRLPGDSPSLLRQRLQAAKQLVGDWQEEETDNGTACTLRQPAQPGVRLIIHTKMSRTSSSRFMEGIPQCQERSCKVGKNDRRDYGALKDPAEALSCAHVLAYVLSKQPPWREHWAEDLLGRLTKLRYQASVDGLVDAWAQGKEVEQGQGESETDEESQDAAPPEKKARQSLRLEACQEPPETKAKQPVFGPPEDEPEEPDHAGELGASCPLLLDEEEEAEEEEQEPVELSQPPTTDVKKELFERHADETLLTPHSFALRPEALTTSTPAQSIITSVELSSETEHDVAHKTGQIHAGARKTAAEQKPPIQDVARTAESEMTEAKVPSQMRSSETGSLPIPAQPAGGQRLPPPVPAQVSESRTKTCPQCGISLAAEELERHLRMELNYFAFLCGLCFHQFLDEDAVKAHFQGRRSKHPGRPVAVVERPDEAVEQRLDDLLDKAQ